jgi:acyl-CoA synthetase (AMP-forming)/AMP-acid ligase II
VAFVQDPSLDGNDLRRRCARHLPPYMVPRDIHLEDRLPLNANGKFDRNALVIMLEESER